MRSVEQRIHLLPCYRQRVVEAPFNLAHPTLEGDPEFRLENHLKRFRLPSGIDERQATRQVLRDYLPVLDRSRPLWELLSFEGWPGGRTLVISKVHHALVDGIASVKLTKRLFDLRPAAPGADWTSTLLDQLAPPNLIALRSGMGHSRWTQAPPGRERPIGNRTRETSWRLRLRSVSLPPTCRACRHRSLCGHRCLQQVGILPAGGNLGYAVTILSYNHDRYVAMTADPRLMPDLYLIKGFVQTAFEELQLAAEIRPERRACKTAVVGASP